LRQFTGKSRTYGGARGKLSDSIGHESYPFQGGSRECL